MDLCSIDEIKALLHRHGFHFSKNMGQNFLVEDWVPRDLADMAGLGQGVGALEIGPGIGPLTKELSSRVDKVVSVELDKGLLPILAETLADCPNVNIISGDILTTNIPALVQEHFGGLTPVACANLPYNITTPAITTLLQAKCFQSITVMIQKEAAKRICAKPGDSDYGVFSIMCQYNADVEILFDVPPTCFIPSPKVTSAVLQLIPKAKPEEVDDETHFFKVVSAAFAHRRKTLLNSLSATMNQSISKEHLAEAMLSCDLPIDIRGQGMSIMQFATLSKAMRERT